MSGSEIDARASALLIAPPGPGEGFQRLQKVLELRTQHLPEVLRQSAGALVQPGQ